MLRHKRLIEAEESQAEQHRRSFRQDLHQTPVRSRQQQQQQQQQQQRRQQQQHQEELDEDELESRWQKAAQMLSDSDEYLQSVAGDERNQLLRSSNNRNRNSSNKTTSQPPQQNNNEEVDVEIIDDDEDDHDDASSISFAQSGCHSILSAWRLKSASRRSRDQRRPVSVLSNGSSVATRKSGASGLLAGRGKSPAASTRIPLGPRQAQHFVTNSRRRRRANELILNTLEARRRAQMALSRQNASLLGSASYLAGAAGGAEEPLLADHYAAGRLSLSPSPVSARDVKSPSPAPRVARPAPLSDLGGRASAAAVASAAVQAQRNRLLLSAANRSANNNSSDQLAPGTGNASSQLGRKLQAANKKQVPLAKLDQNSSDLYSSNSSSADSGSSSDSSSGSQFTQLVSSELAPDCGLLVEQALRHQYQRQQQQQQQQQRRAPIVVTAARTRAAPPTSKLEPPPPRVPERQRRKQRSPALAATEKRKVTPEPAPVATDTADSEANSGKLRRGALRRDSIRRLRLNRAPSNSLQQQHQQPSSQTVDSSDLAPSSDSSSSQHQSMHQVSSLIKRSIVHQQQVVASPRQVEPKEQQQRVVITRRRSPDLENNPFLNRHHIRTSSVRSARPETQQSASSFNGQRSTELPERAREPEEKRTSWTLFGLSTRGSSSNEQSASVAAAAARVEPPPKPRFFSQAQRANSSETMRISNEPTTTTTTGTQPQVKQQPAAADQVRQVERMLRQMQPNQVFTSYSREQQTTKSLASSKETELPTMNSSRESAATVPIKVSSERIVKPPVAVRSRPPSQQSSHRQQQQKPTREVSEGSRTQSELTSNGQPGNRRQVEVAESWRLEKSGPREVTPRRQVSEQRLVSQRMELIRSSSISPPLEFADLKLREKKPLVARRSPSPILLQRTSQQQVVAPRSLSEERPQVAARRRHLATTPIKQTSSQQRVVASERSPQISPPKQVNQQREQVMSQPKTPQVSARLTASLPQFERTADDEFRKRVDYLRKLARANLSDEPTVSSSTSKQQQQQLTRPMSTNWRPQVTEDQMEEEKKKELIKRSAEQVTLESTSQLQQPKKSSIFDDRAKWNLGSAATRQMNANEVHRAPATTNLDALLADRYQVPVSPATVTATKWRRSNSSLASINAERPAEPRPPLRPASPVASDAGSRLTERSVASRASQSSAVMKLVVKEKSAPRLDYAIVEQRPVMQRALQQQQQQRPKSPDVQSRNQSLRNPTVEQSVGGLQQQRKPIAANAQQHQQQQMIQTTRTPVKTAPPTNQQQPATRVRSPLRVASPRSPEFGALAASSNDDSAIASSVSSPSLSFMMNSEQQQQKAAAAAAAAAAQRATSPVARVLRPRFALSSDNPTSALQSILRRHQQQSTGGNGGDSSDSSQAAVQSSPSGGDQPQEPLFRSDARSPEPHPSALRPLSPLGQATSNQQQQQQSSPPKRVHFNDRTSIRSFESISSLASNSTAVANTCNNNNNNDLLRQQVGSPDSMNSASSASRLSVESPDLRTRGSGAAIYAVRGGDPEFEALNNPQRMHHLYPNQPAYSYPQAPPTQSGAFIRMTAPPSISTLPTSTAAAVATHLQPQIQYVARPTSLTSTQIVPTRTTPFPLEDDEDPSYALRLRQAAADRVFKFAAPNTMGAIHLSPRAAQLASPQQQQQQQQQQVVAAQHYQQQQVPATRRPLNDLLNFQTEV